MDVRDGLRIMVGLWRKHVRLVTEYGIGTYVNSRVECGYIDEPSTVSRYAGVTT